MREGQRVYLNNCAQCHGLAGDGKGWDGLYLNPTPADLQEDAGVPLEEGDEGKALARVTFGIKGTSMPSWGEFLPLDQRWDAIKYIIESFRWASRSPPASPVTARWPPNSSPSVPTTGRLRAT